MAKQQRKTYNGEKNNKERTMGKLIAAVGDVLKEKGYTGLTIANIAKQAKVDRALVNVYFGGVNNLIETYIKGKDYWVAATVGAMDYFGSAPTSGSKGFLEGLLFNQIKEFSQNEEMQKVVTWQISEKSDIMSMVTREREKMSALFFAFADKELTNKNIDLRALSAIMVAGIYYLVLHSKHTDSPFCEIDLNTTEGMDRIRTAIQQIVDWTYEK